MFGGFPIEEWVVMMGFGGFAGQRLSKVRWYLVIVGLFCLLYMCALDLLCKVFCF